MRTRCDVGESFELGTRRRESDDQVPAKVLQSFDLILDEESQPECIDF